MAKFDDNTKMPFGKHKGLKLEDVPATYLLWLLDQMMEDDDKARLVVYIMENKSALESELKNGR